MKKRIFVFLFGMVLFACSSYAQLMQADLDAAGAGRLAVVAFGDLPPSGTFWSWANGWATPFDIWPDLTCYDLGGGSYLLDDRGYSYDEAARTGRLAIMVDDTSGPLGADGGPSLPLPWSAGDCGCAPWLTISLTGTNALLVSAHRLVAGEICSIYSSTNIALALTNWSFETNLLAGVGPGIVLVQMGGRSNLFFRAAVTNYQATNYVVDTDAVFAGLTHDDTQYDPPDTMGASGGTDAIPFFLEVLNGSIHAKGVYSSTGQLLAISTNVSDILGGTIDARVLWDARAGRWVVSSIGGSYAAVAVSRSENPVDFTTNNWYTTNVNLSGTGQIDFDTLGLDDNGIYLSVVRYTNFFGTYSGNTIVAFKKPDAYQGSWVVSRIDFYNSNAPTAIIQPAVNLDPVPTNGYAWFVTKGVPQLGASYQGGAIYYAWLQWQGTNAILSTNWLAITNAGLTYRDYYDLDIPDVTAPEGTALGGGQINLWPIGSRLSMTVIRNGALWTCQAVGLNGTNGVFTNAVYGADQSTNVDRTGVQWLKLNVDSTNGLLGYSAHGRVYDRISTTNVLWYHYPSITVNCAGDMVTGFSGSGATNYISAFYSWRLANGTVLDTPGIIWAGTTNSYDPRWGDYSATTLDPADDHSFWTVQEVALPSHNDDPTYGNWATVIARIKPKP